MSSPGEINSFAVFDLETTGLPSLNFNKANITELTIHGFPANNLRNSIPEQSRRVNHSLTLLFNPRMSISPKAEELTGLNNYMLEKESCFDENAANLVINFLKHLRQPVCLVAHNGERFDFPILKDAFKKLKMELPRNVLCLDSYTAITKLDTQIEEEKVALLKEDNNHNNEEDFKLNTIPFLNDDETSSITSKAATSPKVPADNFKEPDHKGRVNINTGNTTTTSEEDDTEKAVDWQKRNETTPKQGTEKNATLSRRLKADTRPSTTKFNRRCLDFTTPPKVGQFSRPPAGTYKLENIYIRLYGEQPKVTHQAEADVIMLKDIMNKYGDMFVEWAEKNARPFTSVRALSER